METPLRPLTILEYPLALETSWAMLRAVPLGASAFPEWCASTMLTSKLEGSPFSAADIAMRKFAPTEKFEAMTAGSLTRRAA